MQSVENGIYQVHGAHTQRFSLVAGPCAIESYEMFRKVAMHVKRYGATALRGGIFKMRTLPRSFQGLGQEALEIVKAVKQEVELPFISEITDPRQIQAMADVVDIFQVGARNMYNYELLKELGKTRVPVLLKRGFSAYLDEFLSASEYILNAGNSHIILCERGVRSFEKAMRNTLDLAAVPYLQKRSGLPVIVDPSHATGLRELVSPMCLAAAAAGADGVMIEVHPQPQEALSDGPQALTLEDFENLMPSLCRVLKAVNRPFLESSIEIPNRLERNMSQWMN